MKKSLLLLSIFLFLSSAIAQSWEEIDKTLPVPTLESLDDQFYGCAVDVDGDYAVVGAYGYRGKGTARVLYFNGSAWEQIAELNPSDINSGDGFGTSVAIHDDVIVVGSPYNDQLGGNTGAAYVFVKPVTGWEDMTETAKLIPSYGNGNGYFGSSASMENDVIVIGAPNYGHGKVFVYDKPATGWNDATYQNAILEPSDGGWYDNTASYTGGYDRFGTSVSISNDEIAVGSPNDDVLRSNQGSVYIFSKPPGGWVDTAQNIKLLALDNDDNDLLGSAVAISNGVVVGTCLTDDDINSNQGAAYVYERPATGWTSTYGMTKLYASDGVSNDNFGTSAAIEGDTIVIGCRNDDSFQGAVYVFVNLDTTGWSSGFESTKLTASDAAFQDQLGQSVAISGNKILAGAYWDDDKGSNSGSVYCFQSGVTSWFGISNENQKINNDYFANTSHNYGYSVAIDGDVAVVGSYGYNSSQGTAYILQRNGGTWETIGQLGASDSATGDQFGIDVGISGDVIVVSAHQNDDLGDASGCAYVYEKPVSGWSSMTETAKLTTSDGEKFDNLGLSAAIDGDVIVLGAPGDDDMADAAGAAYVYVKPVSGWSSMTETAKLKPSDGGSADGFGDPVDISGDHILIGSKGDDDLGVNSGAVYVFTKPVSGWSSMNQTAKLKASDGIAYDRFGQSLAIDGATIVVGAPYHTHTNWREGQAYVFEMPGSGWATATEDAILTASDYFDSDQLGWSVSVNGDDIMIGTIEENTNGWGAGAIYQYSKPGANWSNGTEVSKLVTSDGKQYDNFGTSIDWSGSNVVVGAVGVSDNGTGSGAAYFFKFCVSTTSSITEVACDNYVAPSGQILTSTGNYNDTIPNSQGCDSIITIDLTIQKNFATINAEACESYISPSGKIWTTSDTYLDTIPNSNMCDSIITVNLVINTPTYTSFSTATCESYTSPSGKVYTSSNTYNDTIPNSKGCDSIITINLTIYPATSGSVTASTCDSYTSPGGKIFTSTGIYQDTIMNQNGCDSVLTIDLTILESTSFTDSIDACGPVTWMNGTTYSSSNYSAQYFLLNAQGCDSVITLHLTITDIDSTISVSGNTLTAKDTGAVYQWIDCITNTPITGETGISFSASESGQYSVEITKDQCTKVSECIDVQIGGIQDVTANLYSVYPNPVTSQLNIEALSDQVIKTITLCNPTGQVVMSREVSTRQTILDVASLPNGIYIVKVITSNDQTIVQRIVKQ